MNGVQKSLLDMYKDISDVLKSENISFYGHFGTAIGAVRHGGFIPWDDDIDLVVFAEDLPRINEAMQKRLDSEKYYYHIPTADTHPHVISLEGGAESIKNKTAPFIDIFVLHKYPDGKFRDFISRPLIFISRLVVYAADNVPKTRFLLAPLSVAIENMTKRIANGDSNLYTIYQKEFKECLCSKDCYGEPVWVNFEDSSMPLPKDYHNMLTRLYGDYTVLPPEDKRTGAGGYPCNAYADYTADTK